MKQEQKSLLKQCLELIAQATRNFIIQKLPKKAILLMGSSKAGKTTLLYYLLGKELNYVENDLGVYVLEPGAIYHDAYIGTGYESTTVYPNIPPDCGVQDLTIIDMPGLDDSRPTFKLINLFVLLELLNLIQEVHICQVIEQLFVENDQLQEQIQKICSFINSKLLNTQRAVSFIITKVEDEDCIQKLENTLEYLRDQPQNNGIAKEIQTFIADKKYVFRNQQPKIEQGLQLKQQIIDDSVFIVIDKRPERFLSQGFCNHMIGQSRLEEFKQYLTKLLSEAEIAIFNSVKLVTALLQYEYGQIIFLNQHSKDQVRRFQQEAFSKIKNIQPSIILNEINRITLPQFLNAQITKEKHIYIFKIFKYPKQYPITQWMQHMGSLLENFDGWSQLTSALAKPICMSFKQLAALLKILTLIDSQQLKPSIDNFIKNNPIKQEIHSFYVQWQSISNKLIQSPNLSQTLSDEKIRKAYEAYYGPIKVFQQIIPVFSYQQIRNKEVRQLVSIVRQKPHKKLTKQKKVSKISREQMQNLPSTVQSLEIIFQTISTTSKTDETFLTALIKKASSILVSFSYYEQAILFLMSVSDIVSITQLLQLGLIYSLLSTQFVRQIMLKYYLNSSFECYNQMCLCYRFLLQQACSQQAFNTLQRQFMQECLNQQSLEKVAPKANIPTIQLFFIQPILKQRQQFLTLLKQLQNQFEDSPCSTIFSSTAISQIMK